MIIVAVSVLSLVPFRVPLIRDFLRTVLLIPRVLKCDAKIPEFSFSTFLIFIHLSVP